MLAFSLYQLVLLFRKIEHLFFYQGVYMEYQLVFTPSLDIAPADFVTAWNEAVSTQEVAQAQLVSNTTKSFSGPVLDIVLLVVNSVGLGLGTNVLYDLIKGATVKQKKHKRIKITKLEQPNGPPLLVIEEED